MQRVLVVGSGGDPLMPCHPARARQLLRDGNASVVRRVPFVIRLSDRDKGAVQPLSFKTDPGSITTGVVLVAEFPRGHEVLFAAELRHRGRQIKDGLDGRRGYRRGRRSRHLPYRAARGDNRRRPKGWLPPSLLSR